MRTVPSEQVASAFKDFDQRVRAAIGELVGDVLPHHAWLQAQLSLAQGGLGLRSVEGHASGAYLASLQ
eukprot:5265545-Amphidinium_carterae.1